MDKVRPAKISFNGLFIAMSELTADPVPFLEPACYPILFVVSIENEYMMWKRLVSVIFTIP